MDNYEEYDESDWTDFDVALVDVVQCRYIVKDFKAGYITEVEARSRLVDWCKPEDVDGWLAGE